MPNDIIDNRESSLADTPILDPDGKIGVLEDGEVIATLKPLKFFDGQADRPKRRAEN